MRDSRVIDISPLTTGSCNRRDSVCYHPLPPGNEQIDYYNDPAYPTQGPKCSTGFIPQNGACVPDTIPVETLYAGPIPGGVPYGNDTSVPPVVVASPGSSFNVADFSISDVVNGLTQGTVFGLPKIVVVGVAAYFLFFGGKKGRKR